MTQPQHSYLTRAHKEPPAHAPNAALLIDFDNVTMAIRSDLQTELKRLLQSEIIRGKVAVQRAYADWRRYPQYIVPLSESSIDLIFAPAHGANKKNATDIRLAIDALELVFTAKYSFQRSGSASVRKSQDRFVMHRYRCTARIGVAFNVGDGSWYDSRSMTNRVCVIVSPGRAGECPFAKSQAARAPGSPAMSSLAARVRSMRAS